MVTGYQRQHRKSITYVPINNADPQTTDQYTRLISHASSMEGLYEIFSKACELSSISGMVLLQPYLDYLSQDPAQGTLKLKLWEYNSFLVDPFFRNPDMSDAQVVWCQEYITKEESRLRFGDAVNKVKPLMGTPQSYSQFYFLPENHYMSRNDLLVLSYVWYKSSRKKKRLYSRSLNQFFDFAGDKGQAEQIIIAIPDIELVTVEVPTWKTSVVLNDYQIYNGENPLGFDECPFIPVYWNYDPQIPYADLRVRSLVRTMRDPQALFNFKVITNNDIASATINAGWKRKVGAVANEDNLKKAGQGWDVIINEGYELGDCEKIIPSAVPQSDLELAQQMQELIFATSGIQMENWAGQEDHQISSLTLLLKQAANLMVFQKYFDQWDYAFKLLGERLLQTALNNWNEQKVALMIGEDPSPHFFARLFAKYQTVVEEGLLTPTQRNLQAQQMLDINTTFGREVIPPSMIIKDMNVQGKSEILQFLQNQEEQAQQLQQEQSIREQVYEEARLKELYSKAVSNIALARERHGRTESNIGLFEERLSEITKNRSLALREKMEALEKLVDVIARYGEIETQVKVDELDIMNDKQEKEEDEEKAEAKSTALANQFLTSIMSSSMNNPNENLEG